MIVELRSLRPNPLRDFTVDPIDDTKVGELKDSIKQDGFWGGIVCRAVNGHIEIAAGHHRVKAAIAAGIRQADLYVADEMDDAAMVRVYAVENATQRGNSGTAIAGTVAAAIRFLGKAIMTGMGVGGIHPTSHAHEILRGQIASDKGLGWDVITKFLDNVPGVNVNTVKQQLANLKSSGDYARIIASIREEIEREQREALKALEQAEKEKAAADTRAQEAEARRKQAAADSRAAREAADRKRAELEQQRAEADAKLAAKRKAEAEAELKQFDALRQTRDTARKAAEKSAEREKTFDFEGVAAHLTTAHHIDVFRQLVTSEGVRPYLPVRSQAALARRLVELAKSRNAELSGGFIREEFMTLLMGAKHSERTMRDEDRQAAIQKDFQLKARQYQHDAVRNAALMLSSIEKFADLMKRWPKGVAVPIASDFRAALRNVQKICAEVEKRL